MRQGAVHTLVAASDSAESRRAADIERFVHNHAARLVGALTLVCGSRAAAEDALQDALVKAWHRRDQPIDELTAWITVVAMNGARSGWRRRKAEQRAVARLGARATTPPVDASVRDDELVAGLRALPRRERQVAVLHYVMDRPVAEVAAALSVSEGTVKTLLHRARGHLAARLGAVDGTPDAIGGGDDRR